MGRVNVFLKDDLLKAVDTEAQQAGMNRSALIQAALTNYLETQQKGREETEAKRRMDEACRAMDALAKKLGDWDPVKIIREFRDARSSKAHNSNIRPARKRRP